MKPARFVFLLSFIVTVHVCGGRQTSISQPARAQPRASEAVMTDDTGSIDIVFSDVDGTLVHYTENAQSHVGTEHNEIIKLPPSATGMQGIISTETLRKCQELRRLGKKFVLVSGMRSSTLWKRIPFLPRADAYCSEAGGRIFYPVEENMHGPTFRVESYEGASESDLTPFGLQEDMEWRARMEVTAGMDGFPGNEIGSSTDGECISIERRQGQLWSFCLALEKKGFVVDTKGYSTCFRVNKKQQALITNEEFEELYSIDPPQGLATSVNLGCVDFYPYCSGKRNCCEYVAKKLCGEDALLEINAACLCDDDNDLEMALACKHAFVPGISSESMANVVKANPTKITATGGVDEMKEGTGSTERALDSVLTLVKKVSTI